MSDAQGPLEMGMLAGREYAARVVEDRAKLRRVAQSRSAEDTQAAIDWSLIEAGNDERPVAFWSGFVHGVREFLVDEAAASPDQRESDST
jgi:hypothetical protein